MFPIVRYSVAWDTDNKFGVVALWFQPGVPNPQLVLPQLPLAEFEVLVHLLSTNRAQFNAQTKQVVVNS